MSLLIKEMGGRDRHPRRERDAKGRQRPGRCSWEPRNTGTAREAQDRCSTTVRRGPPGRHPELAFQPPQRRGDRDCCRGHPVCGPLLQRPRDTYGHPVGRGFRRQLLSPPTAGMGPEPRAEGRPYLSALPPGRSRRRSVPTGGTGETAVYTGAAHFQKPLSSAFPWVFTPGGFYEKRDPMT